MPRLFGRATVFLPFFSTTVNLLGLSKRQPLVALTRGVVNSLQLIQDASLVLVSLVLVDNNMVAQAAAHAGAQSCMVTGQSGAAGSLARTHACPRGSLVSSPAGVAHVPLECAQLA